MNHKIIFYQTHCIMVPLNWNRRYLPAPTIEGRLTRQHNIYISTKCFIMIQNLNHVLSLVSLIPTQLERISGEERPHNQLRVNNLTGMFLF